MRHNIAVTLPWMREGTSHLLAVIDKLTDLRAASALPGWTCAHVIGHLARNAEALTRLATWARTGVETPMYSSRAQRVREIDQTAALSSELLRADVVKTAATLDAALGQLTPDQWRAEVRSALGRAIPAAEVPWMRIREVWLHAVDLGATMEDLPAGVVDLLLDDVTTMLTSKEDCPSVLLVPADRDRTWHLGPADAAMTITAPAADLAGWITGRLPNADRPPLPPWL